jgi:ribulose bisphosphate carboxylase small subunit
VLLASLRQTPAAALTHSTPTVYTHAHTHSSICVLSISSQLMMIRLCLHHTACTSSYYKYQKVTKYVSLLLVDTLHIQTSITSLSACSGCMHLDHCQRYTRNRTTESKGQTSIVVAYLYLCFLIAKVYDSAS